MSANSANIHANARDFFLPKVYANTSFEPFRAALAGDFHIHLVLKFCKSHR